MNREIFIAQLLSYAERFPFESETTGPFIQFVQANSDCFERSLSIGHVTASGWVVDRSGARTLLTHHRKLGRWLQLGGHLEGDSSAFRSALREVEEESGLSELQAAREGIFDLDIHRIPGRKGEAAHLHYDVRYAFRSCGDERYRVSAESHALAWVRIAELEAYTSEESVLRMRRKWLEQASRTP